MSSSSKRTIGFAGAGYWGKNILRNLNELGAVKTVCESCAETRGAMKVAYPPLACTAEFDDILADPEIEAVAIATPATTHYRLARKALLAGKDVYVEKPLSLLVAEGRELVDIAEKEGRILMVGHLLQYHPAVERLKELISDGELGELCYIYSNRLNIGKLRAEENVLWSFAPHDISVILSLLNESPVQVNSFGQGYLNRDIYDTTITYLTFANGVAAHIFVSWLHPFKEQRLVVVGSEAMAVFDDRAEDKLVLYPHKVDWTEDGRPMANKAEGIPVELPTCEPLKAEMQHFIECVKTRQAPRTDGHEGLRVLEVLRHAEESIGAAGNGGDNVKP